MKIKCNNKGTKWLFNRDISSERIEFDEKGIAIVNKEVGDMWLKSYPDLTKIKSQTKT